MFMLIIDTQALTHATIKLEREKIQNIHKRQFSTIVMGWGEEEFGYMDVNGMFFLLANQQKESKN